MDYLVDIEELRSFVTRVFLSCGFSEAQSRMASDVLIFADQRGIHSHGTGNLHRIYLPGIRSGQINPASGSRIIQEDAATALIDAGGGLGLVAATEAMNLAIKKASVAGVAVVGVRNSSHFGCASFYSMRAEAAGMIGIAMSNLGAQVIARPPDGTVRMLGTNPISIATPAGEFPSLALDMSTTVVSTGKIRIARQSGKPVPAGWLVDEAGADVTDPARFFQNEAELQMLGGHGASGGYKGYGLALMVDALAGILPGAAVGPDPDLLLPGRTFARSEDHNVGHLFIVIDVARFRPVAEFRQAMDRMLGALLGCPHRAGCDPVAYPGYPEAHAIAPGSPCVAIDSEDFQNISRIADELALPLPTAIQQEELACGCSMERKKS